MGKYIFKYGFIFIITLLLVSCNNSFLDRYPLDEISSETFWNTESDLETYNNGLYNYAADDDYVPIMRGHDINGDSRWYSIWCIDQFSDNVVSQTTRYTNFMTVRAGINTIPSEASSQWFGYKGWYFIRACNIGLANYDNAEVSDDIKNEYKAEAHLFRGWFYADKVSKFGDVPWVETELDIDSEELYAERTDRETAMDNVLEDLNFACTYLPDDWGDGNAPGRLNRWCALLVKSRVCLFEGTWRKYHDGTDADLWLQEAADAAEELIDDGPYSLYSTGDTEHDYNASHRATDLTGNSEVLYWRKYETGVATNQIEASFKNHNGGATKNMVEDYLCTDGLPISLSPLYAGDAQIEDVFENRDPRLRQSILHPDDREYYEYGNSSQYTYPRLTGMTGGWTNKTGYHIIKSFEVNAAIASYNTSTTPAITLRLGEALLNFAEAKAELGTLSQADLDKSINLLRDRVGMINMDINNIPVDPKYTDDGVSSIIVEIRRERRVELFNEGFRYDDLRRWGQGEKLEEKSLGILWDDVAIARYPGATVNTYIDEESGKSYIDPYYGTDYANPVFDESKNYLWPIPLDVLSQNPNIGQNPGW